MCKRVLTLKYYPQPCREFSALVLPARSPKSAEKLQKALSATQVHQPRCILERPRAPRSAQKRLAAPAGAQECFGTPRSAQEHPGASSSSAQERPGALSNS